MPLTPRPPSAPKQEILEKIAAAIATRRGMRRGVPMISNVLDILPSAIKKDILDDAEGVYEALFNDPNPDGWDDLSTPQA